QRRLLRLVLALLGVLSLCVLAALRVLSAVALAAGQRGNLGGRQLLLLNREADEVRGRTLAKLWHSVAGLKAEHRTRRLAHGWGLATSRPHAVILRGRQDCRGVLRNPRCRDLRVQLGQAVAIRNLGDGGGDAVIGDNPVGVVIRAGELLGRRLGLGRGPDAQLVVALRALLGGHGLLVILRHR